MARLTCSFLLLVAGSISALAASDSALLSLLPAETQMVTSMDVQASRSSNFGQFMLRQMASNDKSFQELIEQTGFDPRSDLQTLVIAAVPSAASQSKSRFLVLARGVFDQTRITAGATAKGMTAQTVEGATVLTSKDGDRQMALAFPESQIAVFGDRASVEQVLRNRANPTTLSADLQTQISAAGSDNDAWFASTLPANDFVNHVPQAGKGMGDQMGGSQAMQAVLQSNGGIRFGSSIQLSFNALTRSDKDATSLTDFIRFVSSFVQMQRQNDPRAALLAPAMDGMKLQADGRQVYTSLVIPEADLEQIIASQQKPAHHSHAR